MGRDAARHWFTARRIKWLLLAVAVIVVGGYGGLEVYEALTIDSEAGRLATLLGLRSGSVVGEVGAGKGKMTVRVARLVGPGGHLFSTEISASRLADIRQAAANARLGNVTVIEGGERETHLPVECCDAIFMRKVYHHFTSPSDVNASLYRAVRPGGILAIIDFSPRLAFWLPRPKGVPENRGGHGVPQKVLIEELSQAGFRLEQVIDDWYGPQYCVVFRKPGAAPVTVPVP